MWSKMSYSGDMEGCHACPRTDGRTECEDRARILETEFAIWSPDGGAIWWVYLELMLVVPPSGQNWNQWSVKFEFSSCAIWWVNSELMLVVSSGQNWNQ